MLCDFNVTMKLILAVVLACLGLAGANVANRIPIDQRQDLPTDRKDYLLKNNRIPKERASNAVGKTVNWMDTCSECKDIVEKINAIIDDDAKIQRVKFMLSLACDMLPAESREECKNLVNNLDALIHQLRPMLKDPQAFCTSIHLCGSGNGSGGRVMKVMLLLVKKQLYHFVTPDRAGDVLCDECQFAVKEAKTLWDQQSIQDDVKQFLDQLCGHLGQYKDTCDNLVDAYFPLLVSEIDQLLSNPVQTCTDIGLCNTKTIQVAGLQLFPSRIGKVTLHHQKKTAIMNFINRMKRIQTRTGASTSCSLCVFSVNALLATLKADPQLLQSWATGLQQICRAFPTELQAGCNDFLGIYMEPVLRVTIDSISGQEVCQLLQACPASTGAMVSVQRPATANNAVVCESCRLVAGFLKTEFQQPDFQNEIKEELKTICDFIPGQYATQCDAVLDDYIPQVFQMVIARLDPDTICPEMKMCPPQEELHAIH
jgi:saposin